MRRLSSFQAPNIQPKGVAALTILLALVVGISPLVYNSPLAPLIVGGGIAVAAIGIVCFLRPTWPLYAAVLAIFLPTGLLPGPVQSLLNRLMLGLALIAWLFDTALSRRPIVLPGATLWMLGFLTWIVFTLTWAPSTAEAATKIGEYLARTFLFLILVVNTIRTRRHLDGLLRTCAISGWALLAVSLGVVLIAGYRPGGRLQVLATNINELGAWVLVMMPGVLWQAVPSSGKQRTWALVLSVVYVLLAIVVVALSGSRGGALSALAILVAFWFWKPTRVWGKVGLVLLVLAILCAPLLFSTVARRFMTAEEGVLGGREPIWEAGWTLIQDHFWGGVGIGNADLEVMPYLRKLTDVHRHQTRSLHNPLMQVWAESGLVGLVLYLAVVGSALWSFVREYRRGKGGSGLAPYFALVASVFVGFMISWIKGGGMEHNPGYFLLLALLLLPARLAGKAGGAAIKISPSEGYERQA